MCCPCYALFLHLNVEETHSYRCPGRWQCVPSLEPRRRSREYPTAYEFKGSTNQALKGIYFLSAENIAGHIYLVSGVLISEEIEDLFRWDWEPERSGSTEHNPWRPAWVVDTLPGHDPNIIGSGSGQCGPCVCCGSTHSRAEAYHHPLSQLQNALPSFVTVYNCAHTEIITISND